MAAPRARSGVRSPNYKPTGGDTVGGGQGGVRPAKGGRPSGNGSGGNKNKGKGKGKGKNKGVDLSGYKFDMTPLNPPFDPRTRRIGNPSFKPHLMKRGWVQTLDNLRVDFLFNPSMIELSHGVNLAIAQNPEDEPDMDPGTPDYASLASSTSLSLLYDRTYEVASQDGSYASKFGIMADIAAWYMLLGMLDQYPTNWKQTIIQNPARIARVYVFLGPRMPYYGWLTGVGVTITHWSQTMVPMRGMITVSVDLLPHRQKAPGRGNYSAANYTGTTPYAPNAVTPVRRRMGGAL